MRFVGDGFTQTRAAVRAGGRHPGDEPSHDRGFGRFALDFPRRVSGSDHLTCDVVPEIMSAVEPCGT